MPKLPAIKPRQVVRFLEQNGFVLDHPPAAISSSTIPPVAAARWFPLTIASFRKERRCRCWEKPDSLARNY